MDYPSCEQKSCINWKNRRCSLKSPEKSATSCLDFEDSVDFLRLKADARKGTLTREKEHLAKHLNILETILSCPERKYVYFLFLELFF